MSKCSFLGILDGSVLYILLGQEGRNTDERDYIPSSKNRGKLERLCGTECLTEKISISKCEEICLAWWGRQGLYIQVLKHFSVMFRDN